MVNSELVQLLRSKWIVYPLIYSILLVLSHIVNENQFQTESFESKDAAATDIVIISDPSIQSTIVYDQLSATNSVIKFNVSETSFKQNAANILDSLSRFNNEPFHLIGEGIGGSVALHMIHDDPDKFNSITLINANGVVELELLGGYHLNNAIYRSKAIALTLMYYGLPHFGLLNDFSSKIISSKSQYASDQREIRKLFTSIEAPSLILHSNGAKIREEVSIEHHRLLPQSELVFTNEDEIGNQILTFIEDVNNKEALDRSMISSSAQEESLQPFDPTKGIKAEGSGLLVLMLIIMLSTLISEDLTCIGTGLMIARGLIGFIPGTIACLLGIFIGDILLYLAGRWIASSTLHKAPIKWFIKEKDIQLSYHWFEAKGPSIIIASRFIPGTRLPTYFSAGAIGASFGMFILYFGIASIIWTPILVGLAVILGQEMINYFSLYQDYALWVLLGVLTLLWVLFKIIIPSFTYKGRRLLVGRFKRIRNWEFWSPFVIYMPVIFYTILSWIKHRSITLVTLANPSIKNGGFVKESKHEILSSIKQSNSVAKFALLSSDLKFEDKLRCSKEFMSEHTLDFPIVLKPDVGERGKGVEILKNRHQLERQLKLIDTDYILQEYIDGVEFGVFYYKYPKSGDCGIFSITRKTYLWLEGDGEHTLEELILKDDRAVCLAEIHFEQHVDTLFNVPEKGKRIPLVEIGTHSRGSIFTDAIPLNSKFLESKIEEISSSMNGFYFGRFDVKVPTEQHLKEGAGIKVLEVNGITSEATHIYDPKFSIFYAIKVLMKQWKMAYEIAKEVKLLQPDLKPPGPVHILNRLR